MDDELLAVFHRSLNFAWQTSLITEDEFYEAMQWLIEWEEIAGSYRDGI